MIFDATVLFRCISFSDLKKCILKENGYESLMYIMEGINITINEKYRPGEVHDGFPINGFCDKC